MIIFDKVETTHILMEWQTQTRRLWHFKNSICENRIYNAYYNQPPTPFHADNIFAKIEVLKLKKWDWDEKSLILPNDAFKCGFHDPKEWFDYYTEKNRKHEARESKQARRYPEHWIVDFILVEPYWEQQETICGCGDHFWSFLPNTDCYTCQWVDTISDNVQSE